jgi:DNA-binding NtrC family response regulator
MGGSLDLLVVDDDLDFADLLCMLLERRHRVRCVSSVSDALRAVEAAPPDVVLCDYHLGRRRGSEVLERLAVTHPQVRRILCSAARPTEARDLVERGIAQVFFDKLGPLDSLFAALAPAQRG